MALTTTFIVKDDDVVCETLLHKGDYLVTDKISSLREALTGIEIASIPVGCQNFHSMLFKKWFADEILKH